MSAEAVQGNHCTQADLSDIIDCTRVSDLWVMGQRRM